MSNIDQPLKPIEFDYSLPWVRGWEYISQEGSSLIERMRKERGWSREDVWELTDGVIDPNTLGLIEGDYGIGYPFEVDHLIYLAALFGCRPGELLDRIYEEKGNELLEEDDG
jgi:hypothetical protein